MGLRISPEECWKYASIRKGTERNSNNEVVDYYEADVFYDSNGNIPESCYSQAYRAKLHQADSGKATTENENVKKKENEIKSNNNPDNDGKMGYCWKFFWTITLILPIWWLLKLPFTMGWAGIKLIYYIISWPFRLLLCCCCNTKLIPGELGAWPKYEF